MTEHYYSAEPTSAGREVRWSEELRGGTCQFVADAGVFSIGRVDRGTRLLIRSVELSSAPFVLDLGCGYGAIGLAMAKAAPDGRVILTDVNRRAVELARRNLANNGVTNAEARPGDGFQPVADMRFDIILTNPPIRAGKRLLYGWIDEAPRHLREGGRLCTVIRTQQGAKSFARRLGEVFERVDEIARGSGYRVYCAARGMRGLGHE